MARMHSMLLKVAGALLALTTAAAAQDYPTRPVRVVIPFAPGGINDVVGRLVATHLSERLGKQFIAENRPGGGGIAATEAVVHAPKDGYTLLILSIANANHPSLHASLPYDLLRDIEPVSMIVTSPNMFAVNPNLPVKSVKEYIALAKSKPGDLQYASGGIGGSLHLGFELFKMLAKIDVLHVPFRGAGPGSIDVIAGNTTAIMSTTSSISAHVRSGKLRGLAISTPQRLAEFPDVPTFIEAGMPEYDAGNWIGIGVPAGTPKAIIDKLHKEISAIQDRPDVQQQMVLRGAGILKQGPAEFRAHIEKETKRWADVVKNSGMSKQ